MVDFETVAFIKMLDDLAARSQYGIMPFSEATEETWDAEEILFYDDTREKKPIVIQALVDDLHHDIITLCGSEDFTASVVCTEDEKPFIEVMSTDRRYAIVIEDGKWYFA